MEIQFHSLSRLNQIQSRQMKTRSAELARQSGDKDKLREVCSDFEAIFLQQIFKQMRKTAKMGGPSFLDGGMGEEIFKDMLYEKYSQISARNNGIGIGQMVYDYILRSSNQRGTQ